MSVQDYEQPTRPGTQDGPILQTIEAVEKELGGFVVRRILPAPEHKRVGPFIFFDHIGPSTFAAGAGMDVRPHPHIGLSTLTYLFDGQILHRDSLGYVQSIEPGAVNWMTAGRGIVHSERTPDALRRRGFGLHGIQIWIALPDGSEEVEPSFTHHPAGSLPLLRVADVSMTLIAGEAFGQRSPVKTWSPLFYLHVEAKRSADLSLPPGYAERALYIVDGEIKVDRQVFGPGRMLVLTGGSHPDISATKKSTVMMLGGAPLASDRIVWWNFSSSSKERLESAKADWRNGRFGQVPGETEFIPLPE
jgi:redox-sensitive bicupin YhaK (pirin superfamily)